MASLKEQLQALRGDVEVELLSDKVPLLMSLIKDEDLHRYVYDLFPPTMKLVEHFLVANQRIGLSCLHRFLTHQHAEDERLNCLAILRENGYDQFIYLKLRHLLYSTEEETFDLLAENLYIVLKRSLKSKTPVGFVVNASGHLKSTLEMDEKVEDVFSQMLDNLTLVQSKTELVEKHLKAMQQYMFPLMHCTLLKFTKNFFDTVDRLLETALECGQWSTLQIGLLTVHDFLQHINIAVSSAECALILKRLFRIAIKLTLETRENADSDQVLLEAAIAILRLFESSTYPPVQRTVAQFASQTLESAFWSKLDQRLDSALVAFITRNGSTRALIRQAN